MRITNGDRFGHPRIVTFAQGSANADNTDVTLVFNYDEELARLAPPAR